MELDHVFVRARVGAPEADSLCALGLSEGSPNTHPGQGTANRRFFFGNAFIELLWIANEDEIASAATRRTQLHERLGGALPDASPFGLCFRPSAGEDAPFATWDYTPAYLPPGMQVEIAVDAPLAEPMWFFLAAAARPDAAMGARRQPLDHPLGLGEMTSLTITVPGAQAWSAPALAARDAGLVRLVHGAGHLLEIGFDGGRRAGSHDFRPALPLVLRW